MNKIKTLIKIFKILQSGENIGDVAILKLTLFNKSEGVSPHQNEVAKFKGRNFIPISLTQLQSLPTNSFGYAYYEFMTHNHLKPFNFSVHIQDIFDQFPVSIRYARVHDMIHVLLGFKTDLTGELGVYAFIAQQHYSTFLDKAYTTARIFTRLVKPFHWRSLRQAENRGLELADKATTLICLPLEDYFNHDLSELRKLWLPNFR